MAKDTASQYHGYFPEYFDPSNTEECIYSAPLGSGPLGFAETVANPVTWSSYDDLRKLRIGVVHGYYNTPQLDEMIDKGQIKADVAPTDLSNMLKLDAGRVDLAVMDRFVFQALKKTAPALAEKKQNLVFNSRLLEEKELFVCFRKGPEGERLVRDLARGLKKVNASAIIATYMESFRD
jgi:polar amino acid transport system substrate-binding protein